MARSEMSWLIWRCCDSFGDTVAHLERAWLDRRWHGSFRDDMHRISQSLSKEAKIKIKTIENIFKSHGIFSIILVMANGRPSIDH